MKQIFIAFLSLIVFDGCKDKSGKIIEDPDRLERYAGFNEMGASFSPMLLNLNGGQVEEDLCADNWLGYMGTPTDFNGNVNNSTYSITWNTYWGREYGSVMSPSRQVIINATNSKFPVFAALAKLVRILGMSKLTAMYGPIIYSQYGKDASSIPYDKESDLYPLFFKQLDSIQTTFSTNKTYDEFKKFDPSKYGGNVPKWQKVITPYVSGWPCAW